MTREVVPPPATDEAIERHQFYTKVSCAMHETNIDINGLGRKVTGINQKVDDDGDKIKEYSTRATTIIACVSTLWVLLSGGLAVYVNSVIETAKHTIEKVSELERKVIILEASDAKNTAAIEGVDKIKRQIVVMQKEIEERQQQ